MRDVSQVAGEVLDDVGVVPGPGVSVLAHSLGCESQSTKKRLRFRALLSDDDTEMSLVVV